MYLKSIEIQGFKSFANRINFKFHDGITAIVGPNGSGKSNVADAVRWVLGEQRIKQLRGAAMADVIFSGTEMRKPLSYASVTITFDNSDRKLHPEYEEVTVARRIYRSGESEYLLNGTPCRLKDVSEIFYDTGIGREGYSLIGQGQIDKILSGKPEDRREMFDEAAGIVKFKRRRSAAQKKLDDGEMNRVRIGDIISELERQSETLSTQAETAKIYLRKKEELKNLDINIFVREHNRLTEQLSSVTEKTKIAAAELDEVSKLYDERKSGYEETSKELLLLEEAIDKERDALTSSGLLRGKLIGEINVLKEQINAVRNNEEHLHQRDKVLQGEIEKKKFDLEAINSEKEMIDRIISDGDEARREAREHLQIIKNEINEDNENIEKNNNTIIELLSLRATTKSKLGRFETMLEQITTRDEELKSLMSRAVSDEAEQEAKISELEQEFAKLHGMITDGNATQSQIEDELQEMREKLAQSDRLLRDTQAQYHQEKSRFDALLNMAERYEGYGGAVKHVMSRRENEKGIIGVVADIIKVDKKYETAIETALGSSIQNVVTEDEDTAKRLIKSLKENKAGRVTFLPLTNLASKNDFPHPQALKEEGAIDTADQLVKTVTAHAKVASSLLGRILVVDNIDNAAKIARKNKHSIRIVTLDGELLSPGGAMSGGAYKSPSSLLSRHRESEELKALLKEIQEKSDTLLTGIDEIKAKRNGLRMQLEEIKSELQTKLITQNTVRMNLLAATEKRDAVEQGSTSLQNEKDELAVKIKEINQEKEANAKELLLSEEKERQMEAGIRKLQDELETKRKEEEIRQERVSAQEIEIEKLNQKRDFEQQNIDRITEEVKQMEVELGVVHTATSKNREDIKQKQDDIASLELTISESDHVIGDNEGHLKEDMARRDKLAAKQRSFIGEQENLVERLGSLDKEIYRLDSQKERLEEAVELQINYMWDEYSITFSTIGEEQRKAEIEKGESANEASTPPTIAAMKRQIAAVKDEIRKLGDVNVNAIEEYRCLSERHTFLKIQHDDLVEGAQSLIAIISELDTVMRRQFNQKFAEIAREFDRVFKEMFGGGKGTLEIMDSEDILEAGIRIIAQPPGKKLQNMMQLSGGERALTAIALIFAIQNLKPSPFCLLDEIESALDENNVGRFSRYLQRLSKNTQFIVITHRRHTMERADRLYGITMQEKGVSALVSVNLVEKDLK
ncbi:MAG: chromosome segregation protein SMC [Lachnospiraceae bacterium]|jgi:chromosome segregation protein|nr:chromosome segregation protein SMC [Lachnospiraceae bacterium]